MPNKKPNKSTQIKSKKAIEAEQAEAEAKAKAEAEAKAEEARMRVQASSWNIELYTESLKSDWLDILESKQTPCKLSPVHDKEFKNDGTPKKPHIHGILQYGRSQTRRQVIVFMQDLLIDGTAPASPEPTRHLQGSLKYLTHEGDKNKPQYNPDDIITIGEFDENPETGLSKKQQVRCMREMIMYINENRINNLATLMNIALVENADWFETLCGSMSLTLSRYINNNASRLIKKDKQEQIEYEREQYKANIGVTPDMYLAQKAYQAPNAILSERKRLTNTNLDNPV